MKTKVRVESRMEELIEIIEHTRTVVLKPKLPFDRIQEKMSVSLPRTNLPKPNPALGNYRGQRVRLLLKDGTVLTGTVDRPQWDFLCLKDIDEIGKEGKLYADWIAVRSDSIARVYPANARMVTSKD